MGSIFLFNLKLQLTQNIIQKKCGKSFPKHSPIINDNIYFEWSDIFSLSINYGLIFISPKYYFLSSNEANARKVFF